MDEVELEDLNKTVDTDTRKFLIMCDHWTCPSVLCESIFRDII